MSRAPAKLRDLVSGRPLPSLRMSEAKFLDWTTEDTRAEWVNGKVELHEPASTRVVELRGWLLTVLRIYASERRLGEVMTSPAMVRMRRTKSLRIPDLYFVAAKRRSLQRTYFLAGPPDLIIEIVARDSMARDWREKYLEYQAAGVKEYWIVDPLHERFQAYVLRSRGYAEIVERDSRVASSVLRGLYIEPRSLWQDPLPSELKVLRDLGVP